VTSDTGFISTEGYAYWVAGYNNITSKHIAKFGVYNTTDSANIPFSIAFDGACSGAAAKASLTYLSADDPYAANSEAGEDVVITTTLELDANGANEFKFELPQWSIAILTAC
jgi:alpha-N-arabinofuranosidase